MSNAKPVTTTKKKYGKIETVCEIYDLNKNTWRKKAAKGDFPGIVRRRGERRLYVNLEVFDRWFRGSEGSIEEVSE